VQRYYLQCTPDEDIDEWSDTRIWHELQARLQAKIRPNSSKA